MTNASSLQIVGIRLQGGDTHEAITDLLWQASCSSGLITSKALIAWLREDPEHEAWVQDDERPVAIEFVMPIGSPSYLRSRTGGEWGDHLLKLPRF
jgi:hypothetical protein